MRKLIYDGKGVKVYENVDHTCVVYYERNYDFDGIVEPITIAELFDLEGMHNVGGVCTHNFMIPYNKDDDRTIREKAIAFAKEHEK